MKLSSKCKPECRTSHLMLIRAQQGEEVARNDLVGFVYERFLYRISRLHSSDRMCDTDDIRGWFMEGIISGIDKADLYRACPIAFIAQHGEWKARSEVRGLSVRRPEIWSMNSAEAADIQFPDDAPDFTEQVEDKAEERWWWEHLVTNTRLGRLTGRPREAMALILSGQVPMIGEPGANKVLAQKLGVSPQRANQIVNRITLAAMTPLED